MSLKVVAHSGDTLLLTDEEDGPGAIVYRDGDGGVFHLQTALARGYWDPSDEDPPDVPADVVNDLRAFNDRWRKQQAMRVQLGLTD